jgi:predicted aldo/keto reductase-like oxidoreductase
MTFRELGLTGLKVVPIGFGGIPIQRLEQETVTALIDQMMVEGINFIDTARGYTTSEQMIGIALDGGKRENFILATKSMSRDYDQMKADIETSLCLLQTDFIDLYQCHLVKDLDQYALIMSENGAYKALLEAKAAGKIGHIGMTAHSASFVNQVIREMPFETLQFPYNLVERQGEPLFEIAHNRGIGVIVMKPIAGGAISNGALSLKFIMNNPHVSVAIPGMDHVDQVATNAAVLKHSYHFSENDLEEMAEVASSLGETFCRRCGYCLPCPQGIDIPTQFLMEGYLTRYNLEDWAKTRYAGLPVKADACVDCGACEPKCPYNLPIRSMLKNVVSQFEKANL